MSKKRGFQGKKGRACVTVTARIAAATAIVLTCLMLICFSSYAFFSRSVSSNSNIIKAANFRVDVAVRIDNEDGQSVAVKNDNGSAHRVDVKAGVTYYVTLNKSKNSTAKTGYCMLTAKNSGEAFYTRQLSAASLKSNGDPTTLSFHLKVTNDTTVTFYAYWGTLKLIDGKEQIITGENVDDKALIITVNGTDNTDTNGDSDTVEAGGTTEWESESSLPDETVKTEDAPKETTEAHDTESKETFNMETPESESIPETEETFDTETSESESIPETEETFDTETDIHEPSDTVCQEESDSDIPTETSEALEYDDESVNETDADTETDLTSSDTSETQSVDETT